MGRSLRVAVVGGGIAGLAAAHRLVEVSRQRARPLDLTLEPYAVRACTLASVKYPGRVPADVALLRVFLGRAGDAALLDRDNPGPARIAHEDIATLLGITAPPVLVRVARHRQALPQYEVGHLDRVAAIEAPLTGLPGLALIGAVSRGVGVTDVVRAAEDTAEQVLSRAVP